MRSATTLVIGTGTTGRAVIADALARGVAVRVWDDREVDADAWPTAEVLAHGTDPGTALDGVDLVVPSPGVPVAHPLLVEAARRGIPVRSELEVAARRIATPIVAVTGTNGKTTVTALIHEVFEAAGWSSVAAGNIGTPLIEIVDAPYDVIVAECSSFQLHFCDAPAFRVGVMLNIDVDHLDWHHTLEHYAAAKAKIMNGQQASDLLVYNADDPMVVQHAKHAPGRSVAFSLRGTPGTYTVDGLTLVDPEQRGILTLPSDRVWAPHDIANLLAVVAVARDFGIADAVVADVARNFAKLPHRLEWICEASGVHFVDDSKATNPHAAQAAIAAFDRVVLIAGGRNKGLDLGALQSSAPRLVGVVAIGDSAPEVVAAFADVVPTTTASSMRDAVRSAASMASAGDTVLLSPACASFDWYSNYAERGNDFAREARAWAKDCQS